MNHTHRQNLRLAFMCMLAPEGGGGGGGGGGKTIEEQLNDAKAALTAAQGQVTTLTGERDTAQGSLTAAQAEVTRLTGQFSALTTTAQTAQAEVTRLTGELTSVTAARDLAQGKLTTAETNIGRLESLCGVKGIDPKAAAPALPEPGAKCSAEDFESRLKSAKSPAEKSKITAEFEKALAEGRIV